MGEDSAVTRADLLRLLYPQHPVFYGLDQPDATGRRITRGRPLWLTRHARRR